MPFWYICWITIGRLFSTACKFVKLWISRFLWNPKFISLILSRNAVQKREFYFHNFSARGNLQPYGIRVFHRHTYINFLYQLCCFLVAGCNFINVLCSTIQVHVWLGFFAIEIMCMFLVLFSHCNAASVVAKIESVACAC